MITFMASLLFATVSGVLVEAKKYSYAVFIALISVALSSLSAAAFVVEHLAK